MALAVKYDAGRLELDRIVRQRNMLLRQVGGRLDESAAATLDVWDTKLCQSGERFGHARATLVERITPLVTDAYSELAGVATPLRLTYDPPWRRTGLATALAEARDADVRRGVSTVGPHRDEVALSINELPARTHASQGEQRTLALALRLAAHRLVAERTGSTPVLVLDDVLSELDAGPGGRSAPAPPRRADRDHDGCGGPRGGGARAGDPGRRRHRRRRCLRPGSGVMSERMASE